MLIRCHICKDIILEQNIGECSICGGTFDSYCGNLKEKLCESCKTKMLNYLFGEKKKEEKRLKKLEW